MPNQDNLTIDTQNPITWEFPELKYHQPNCYIPKEILKDIIVGRWQIKDGVAKIPYTFTNRPYGMRNIVYAVYAYFYYHKHPLSEIEESSKNIIKSALSKIQNNSQGKLEFYEANRINQFFPHGIYFSFIDPEWLSNLDAGALTFPRLNNNGEMQNAYILYPDKDSFKFKPLPENRTYTMEWISWSLNAYFQEMLHGLGITDAIDAPKVESIIAATPDGAFCSVVPYQERISTSISSCSEYCEPSYAIFPGPLDRDIIDYAYNKNFQTCYQLDKEHFLFYLLNSFESMLLSTGVSAAYQFTVSFTTNLAFKLNKPLLPQKASYFIADAGMIGFTIYMEMPICSTLAFANSALIKYLPEKSLEKIPSPLKSAITSNLSIYILNLSQAYHQGQCLYPLLMSAGTSLLGSFGGNLLGKVTGTALAWIANCIPQAITVGCESYLQKHPQTLPSLRNVNTFFKAFKNYLPQLNREEPYQQFSVQRFA